MSSNGGWEKVGGDHKNNKNKNNNKKAKSKQQEKAKERQIRPEEVLPLNQLNGVYIVDEGDENLGQGQGQGQDGVRTNNGDKPKAASTPKNNKKKEKGVSSLLSISLRSLKGHFVGQHTLSHFMVNCLNSV